MINLEKIKAEKSLEEEKIRNKPYFIIIRGPAGVGKTKIAIELGKRLNAEVFHFDKIMEDLGLDYIAGEKWISLWKFLKADKIMAPKFREKLGKGIIIFDGNFYLKEHIKDLIKILKFPYFIFTLKASLEECVKRDKTRSSYLGEKEVSNVFRFVTAFDFGIVINTENKSVRDIVNKIVSCLPK